MNSDPKVFIVIAHWKNYDITHACLESLSTIIYSNYHIVVVDDGSPNDSGMRLKEAFPNVHFILLPKNSGLAHATNCGMQYAMENDADYVLWINNDVLFIKPDFFTVLMRVFEEMPRVGIVGPKILSPDGSLQNSTNSSFSSLFTDMWGIGKLRLSISKFSSMNNTRQVAWLVGMALFFKAELLREIGFLDERFPFGGEDIDIAFRAQKKGWDIYYCPLTEIIHIGSASHADIKSKYHHFYIESPLLFAYKHYARLVAYVVHISIVLAFCWRGLIFSFFGIIWARYRLKARIAFEGMSIAMKFSNKKAMLLS